MTSLFPLLNLQQKREREKRISDPSFPPVPSPTCFLRKRRNKQHCVRRLCTNEPEKKREKHGNWGSLIDKPSCCKYVRGVQSCLYGIWARHLITCLAVTFGSCALAGACAESSNFSVVCLSCVIAPFLPTGRKVIKWQNICFFPYCNFYIL